jgi:phage gpG-like protein
MITDLPVKVGTLAVNFTKQRFREQAWIDNATEPWRRRKPGTKRNRGRALLVDTGRLRRANRIIRTGHLSVTIGNDTPYAGVHNQGFNGVVTIPPHSRKKFKRDRVETGKLTKKGNTRKQTVVSVIGEIPVKGHTRRLNIPQRKFMGRSYYLSRQIERLIAAEINKIFK